MKYSTISGLFEYIFQDMTIRVHSRPQGGAPISHEGISDVYSIES